MIKDIDIMSKIKGLQEKVLIENGLVGIDIEIVDLVKALNKIKGFTTQESCSGHGDEPISIWFKVDKEYFKVFNKFLWAGCHRYWCWKFTWEILVNTGDPHRDEDTYYHYWLRSVDRGQEAYDWGNEMAQGIEEFLNEYPECRKEENNI